MLLADSECPANRAGHCPHHENGEPCHYCNDPSARLREAEGLLAELAKPLARAVLADHEARQTLGRESNANLIDLFDRVSGFLERGSKDA